MTLSVAALIFGAAFLANALNSVAGGGSFISFPALLFAGISPIVANAANTVGVWPGGVASAYAYRKDLQQPRAVLVALGVASFVGGGLGALLEAPGRPSARGGGASPSRGRPSFSSSSRRTAVTSAPGWGS